MFEKLLSLAPYNPGLVPQLAFYSRRMREEASIRRTGTVFLVLAFMIQFFAVLSPPQSTFAAGGTNKDNNLIADGVTSAGNAYQKCKDNERDFEHILRHYGISCADVKDGSNFTLTVANKPNGKPYYSMGHHPFYVANEQHITDIPGVSVYVRPLALAVVSGTDKVETIRLTASGNDGRVFYIMKECGNLISIGVPTPPTKQTVSGPITSTPVTPPSTPAPTYKPAPSTPTTPTPTPPAPTPTPPTPTPPPQTPTPCPYSPTLPITDDNCKPCEKSTNVTDAIGCVVISKAATNVTSGGTDANNTTVKAGDVINYVLSVQNNGKAAVTTYVFAENLYDVLDYADTTDLHGGHMNEFGDVTWSVQSIGPGETLSHQITVKVKDPIPSTPLDPAMPSRFDLNMANTFGNTVNIKVPSTPAKQAEVAAAALPNTGPGESLMMAAGIVILAGYFYSRSTLLARESQIAIKEMANA
jgi:uncharacterized repeat protein (TIGR01451 family)